MLSISDDIEELSGHPSRDFLGTSPTRSFGDLMHPDDVESIAHDTADALQNHRAYTHEYRIYDAAGENFITKGVLLRLRQAFLWFLTC